MEKMRNTWEVFWGEYKESGFWWATVPDYRILFFGHDCLYIALYKFRLRLMKFWVSDE